LSELAIYLLAAFASADGFVTEMLSSVEPEVAQAIFNWNL
jgi:hypothetical protein